MSCRTNKVVQVQDSNLRTHPNVARCEGGTQQTELEGLDGKLPLGRESPPGWKTGFIRCGHPPRYNWEKSEANEVSVLMID